ncbi:MAG: anaerobic ribonucleoside-triphosphate reductase activating protein [Oscillospiraceae bacterium]
MISSDEIRISGVIEESIVDGLGIRYVIFTQGCPHHCVGCHNPKTHDFAGGRLVPIEKLVSEIKSNPLIGGVTFSGGEPFCQPKPLSKLGAEIKKFGKNIWAFSGFTFEEIMNMGEDERELLSLCDILVDGEFVLAEKSLCLKFRGSKNQRIVDVQKSLEAEKVVLADI